GRPPRRAAPRLPAPPPRAPARLRLAAEPGTIVVAERTARAVRSHFELEATDAGWVVSGPRDERELRRAVTPLVGREHELTFLRTTFDHVRREGSPAVVTVVCDAGGGKSRLVRGLLATLDGEAKVLIGRCLPLEKAVTLWPLAEMLKAEAGVLETDRADEAGRKISTLVERAVEPGLAGDTSRTAAALASTLDLRLAADPPCDPDPRERYPELVRALLGLLASLARAAPVVAVVEDVHWADPTMLDVLDELAERLDAPIFLLCTARPDLLRSRPDWGGGRRRFSSVPLDPLTSEESARLVSFLPGVDELPADVRRLILERSGGNPFFLEEIVRHLDEQRLSRGFVEQVEIPDNVQGVILARLDLLSADERRVAQRAAVVGRVFWDGALARLVQVDDLDTA